MILELQRLDPGHNGEVFGVEARPFMVGRAGDADVRILAPGVWDRHCTIRPDAALGFVVEPGEYAPVSVNDAVIQERRRLRPGDRIGLGSVMLQFRLAPTRQRSLVWREQGTWLALAGAVALQIFLALAWPG